MCVIGIFSKHPHADRVVYEKMCLLEATYLFGQVFRSNGSFQAFDAHRRTTCGKRRSRELRKERAKLGSRPRLRSLVCFLEPIASEVEGRAQNRIA